MDELVKQVSQRTGLAPEQARQAVEVVVDYLKNNLPAPLAGQIDTVLQGSTLIDAASQAEQLLGGLFGKKD